MSGRRFAALLMAYGSAPSLDDQHLFQYLRHILQHYRQTDPHPDELEDLKRRYRRIGGSPLYAITESLAAATQQALDELQPGVFSVHWAMKHSPPFIADVVSRLPTEGVERACAVALAPFRSRLSTEGYYREVREAPGSGCIEWSFAPDWNLHPRFLDLWRARILEAAGGEEHVVVFTNHSLPARIREWNDPYPQQFESTVRALAERCRLTEWDFAYQSKGGGGVPWLEPELEEVIGAWAKRGRQRFLLAPVGFLMDHLEVLHDLDVEGQALAARLGVSLRRTRMPNDDPELAALLARLAHARTAQAASP